MVNQLTNGNFRVYGLVSRYTENISDTATAPLLHGSMGHLFGNIVSLVLPGIMVIQIRSLMFASVFVIVPGGLLV